ncbi:hypothetical protein [Desmospora activa]|uniref:Uncharacterized protein n=1 Tax=Desmospora activa DSM 45169 TaxID=1121389 RepID=A0A2T4YZ26_9BACL|nr:hypothetical protein [Desmospora activa]PTM51936.1 hypothetical protein C8J48_3760 [Desmospora activa DSM 45169]
MIKKIKRFIRRRTCKECGYRVDREDMCNNGICVDCDFEEKERELYFQQEQAIEEYNAALKVQGPVEPDFDEWFGSWEVQDAYTYWAFSQDCPSLMEVAERFVPFAIGTPDFAKAVRMIESRIDDELEMGRKRREEEEASMKEAI